MNNKQIIALLLTIGCLELSTLQLNASYRKKSTSHGFISCPSTKTCAAITLQKELKAAGNWPVCINQQALSNLTNSCSAPKPCQWGQNNFPTCLPDQSSLTLSAPTAVCCGIVCCMIFCTKSNKRKTH